MSKSLQRLPDLKKIKVELARRDLLRFLEYVWWMPGPLKVGPHTRSIAAHLTQAVDDYLDGRSTFLIVKVPFRHGKSDLVSRALPAWFLGRCRERQPDVVMTGYGAQLIGAFSRRVKGIIATPRYQEVFPGVVVDPKRDSIDRWAIKGAVGEVVATSLGGQITGSGGDLIVTDDYCKERKEAESPTYRQAAWEAWSETVMTRRAPTSINIVCATPWHVDDLIGRIDKKAEEDPEFPRFKTIAFPAESEEYPTGYLFPERFSPEWYKSQRATLGAYGAAGLLDCSPVARGGNLFNIENITWHNSTEEFPDTRYVRFWDLASTAKERISSSPDRTVGALVGLTVEDGQKHVWLRDMVIMAEEAPRRDLRMQSTIERDGEAVKQGIEAQAGYKDTALRFKRHFKGRRTIQLVTISSDKVVRADPLEAIVEAGHLHVLKAHWNNEFLDDFGPFPSGNHDDCTDALSGAYHMLDDRPATVTASGAFAGVGIF